MLGHRVRYDRRLQGDTERLFALFGRLFGRFPGLGILSFDGVSLTARVLQQGVKGFVRIDWALRSILTAAIGLNAACSA